MTDSNQLLRWNSVHRDQKMVCPGPQGPLKEKPMEKAMENYTKIQLIVFCVRKCPELRGKSHVLWFIYGLYMVYIWFIYGLWVI